MSTTKHVTVWCDVDDCHAWIGHEHTAADARRHARSFGWVRRNGRDLCPHHADATPSVGSSSDPTENASLGQL